MTASPRSQETQTGVDRPSPSIGEQLHRAREDAGISLNDASAATKLKATYLEALERNQFDALPAPIYTKNFIRIYANHLGLDGAELSEEYSQRADTGISLPPRSRTSSNYYITLVISTLLRRRITTAIIVIIVVIVLVRMCGSDDAPDTPPPATPDEYSAPAARDSDTTDSPSLPYTPVSDMTGLLPAKD